MVMLQMFILSLILSAWKVFLQLIYKYVTLCLFEIAVLRMMTPFIQFIHTVNTLLSSEMNLLQAIFTKFAKWKSFAFSWFWHISLIKTSTTLLTHAQACENPVGPAISSISESGNHL